MVCFPYQVTYNLIEETFPRISCCSVTWRGRETFYSPTYSLEFNVKFKEPTPTGIYACFDYGKLWRLLLFAKYRSCAPSLSFCTRMEGKLNIVYIVMKLNNFHTLCVLSRPSELWTKYPSCGEILQFNLKL